VPYRGAGPAPNDLRLRRAAGDSGRILIRGGTIISMDVGVGDFAAGDILIEGKRISAIGPDLSGAGQGGNAIVVHAAGIWRGINDNPWLGFAKQIVLQYLPPPGENAQTCGPGPFSMADTGVVTKQLEIAGYKDIQFEQIDAQVFVGNDLDGAVAFQLAIGPAGEAYREAGKIAEQRHDEIAEALKAELAQYQGPNGVMMNSSSWKVTAKNPG
jgi:hypothetical protein